MDTMLKKSTSGLYRLWVEHLSQAQGRPLRMFCFPYAGGNPDVFRSWRRQFPAEVDICLVHLPGHGKRIGERLFTRLKFLVEEIADVIFTESPDPFVLYGHSMGALISFELARELRRRHSIGPRQLFLSGVRAPTAPRCKGLTFDLPDDEFIAELRRLNGTPPELLDVPDARDFFLPRLRADFEVVDTYVYEAEEPLSCPITVYGGLDDEFVSLEHLREWQKQTSAPCKQNMFPGDHFFIHNSQSAFISVLRKDVLTALYGSSFRDVSRR
jgi:medium-chain acyl-[acyl-carrier-protein] hydrolase